MKLFAGNGCPELATQIADKLGVELGKMELTKFSDGEISVELEEHIRGEDVYIIQSTCRPANDNLMELATIADAAKRSDASRIIAVIPYYGYSRQDRRPGLERTPITSKLVAQIIEAAGVNYVITTDIHSLQQQGFFDIPFVNTSAGPALVEHAVKEHGNEVVTVSPDLGGVVRARAAAKLIGDEFKIAIIDKRRPRAGVSEVMNVLGDVDGQVCVLIDDMIDTAGTLCKAAHALMRKGASEVHAYATHPVLSGKAASNIRYSELQKVVVTDTIPLRGAAQELADEGVLEVISMSSLLSLTIDRLNRNMSISEMYKV